MLQMQFRSVSRVPVSSRTQVVRVAAAKGGFGGAVRKVAPRVKHEQTVMEPCPCASGKSYKNCCQAVHTGKSSADTPEATLRARFAAFAKGQADYIIGTTHGDYHIHHYQVATPGGAEERLREDVAGACNKFAFTGLKIVSNEPGVAEHEGYVSFEYLSRKRSVPGAPVPEEELRDTAAWSRTAERCRFVRTSSGAWQFVDYNTITLPANMLPEAATPAAF
ncbi:hypothetical protein TSOC_009590 [Tetrabaena socialis]|uniref:YchJ-like middle NTF2-like domain-containing protein n=1 Tax=Tetrabaena socialis TaxID=47790 RepID=A0A2J7ZVH5_9CHLO|nr:hypothetical protein TSOC_009590 [Tetrabaena socialis]|eukprot:PNH04264.1 hypothetical protein TSOC_009590 [Tetrabaena socialis]